MRDAARCDGVAERARDVLLTDQVLEATAGATCGRGRRSSWSADPRSRLHPAAKEGPAAGPDGILFGYGGDSMNTPLLAGLFGAWTAAQIALGGFFFQAFAARKRESEVSLCSPWSASRWR